MGSREIGLIGNDFGSEQSADPWTWPCTSWWLSSRYAKLLIRRRP